MMGIKRILFPDEILVPGKSSSSSSRRRPRIGGGVGDSLANVAGINQKKKLLPQPSVRCRRPKRQRDYYENNNNNNNNNNNENIPKQVNRNTTTSTLIDHKKVQKSSSSSPREGGESKSTSYKQRRLLFTTESLGGLSSSSSSSSLKQNNNNKNQQRQQQQQQLIPAAKRRKVIKSTETRMEMDSLLSVTNQSSTSSSSSQSFDQSAYGNANRMRSKKITNTATTKIWQPEPRRISKFSEDDVHNLRIGKFMTNRNSNPLTSDNNNINKRNRPSTSTMKMDSLCQINQQTFNDNGKKNSSCNDEFSASTEGTDPEVEERPTKVPAEISEIILCRPKASIVALKTDNTTTAAVGRETAPDQELSQNHESFQHNDEDATSNSKDDGDNIPEPATKSNNQLVVNGLSSMFGLESTVKTTTELHRRSKNGHNPTRKRKSKPRVQFSSSVFFQESSLVAVSSKTNAINVPEQSETDHQPSVPNSHNVVVQESTLVTVASKQDPNVPAIVGMDHQHAISTGHDAKTVVPGQDDQEPQEPDESGSKPATQNSIAPSRPQNETIGETTGVERITRSRSHENREETKSTTHDSKVSTPDKQVNLDAKSVESKCKSSTGGKKAITTTVDTKRSVSFSSETPRNLELQSSHFTIHESLLSNASIPKEQPAKQIRTHNAAEPTVKHDDGGCGVDEVDSVEESIPATKNLRRSKRRRNQPDRLSMSPEDKKLDDKKKSRAANTHDSNSEEPSSCCEKHAKKKEGKAKTKESTGHQKSKDAPANHSTVPPRPKQPVRETDGDATGSGEITEEWTDEEICRLRQAHKEIDPKSPSFWEEIADIVGGKTAAQCRERWFSFVKTPLVRTKKPSKHTVPATTPGLTANDDDDIFDATPMRALFGTDTSDDDFGLFGSIENLPDFGFGSAIKVAGRKSAGGKTTASQRQHRNGYKTYIQTMKREVNKGGKKERLPKKITLKGGQKNGVSAKVGEGDIELSGRMTPGGTLRVRSKSNEEDDEIDYLEYSDYED